MVTVASAQPDLAPATAALIKALSSALDLRSARVARYQAYYDGEQRLAFATSKFRQAFGSLFGTFADNFCLPPGSPVLTEYGIRLIETLVAGDTVLTHDGSRGTVADVMERPVDEALVRLWTYGSPVARMTDNHPVLATKAADLRAITAKYRTEEHFRAYGLTPNTAYRMDSAPRAWVPAGELEQGDLIWCARPGEGPRLGSDNLMALVGWFMAEGSVSDNGRLAFSLHADERAYQDEIIALLGSVFGARHITLVPTGPRAVQVVTYSKDLCAEMIRLGGRGASGKRLASELMDAENVRPLLRSAFRGDGTRGRSQVGYTTVSLGWATQVQRLLLREGIPTAWRTQAAHHDGTFNHREAYTLTASGDAARRLASLIGWTLNETRYDKAPVAADVDGMVGYVVRGATREPYVGSVWDLTVAGAHSFVLPGQVAVHNCALIVDAVEERLDVEGFRIGPGEKIGGPGNKVMPGDSEGDRLAWQMWQENQLDLYSQIAHTGALIKECSYVLVGPGSKATMPEITIEDATQAIVAYEAGSYRRRKAGLKRWIDEDGKLNLTLYLPDTIEKYVSVEPVSSTTATDWGSITATFRRREVRGENWPLPNKLKVVPLVPLINRPRLDGSGQSELKSVLPLQDAINKLVMDMIVASEFSAYRQRWATGIEIEIDDVSGEPKEQFQAAVDRVWASQNETAKFGTLEATDLSPFVAGVEMLIQQLASQTRTPYHYFLQHGGQPPSGESLRASETGLVAKAERKQRYFGEGWEEVVQLGFKVMGDTRRGAIAESETIWRDPEKKTESEHVDALVKLQSIGVPEEQLWQDAGYTPTQIARFGELTAPAPITVIRNDGSTASVKTSPTFAKTIPVGG